MEGVLRPPSGYRTLRSLEARMKRSFSADRINILHILENEFKSERERENLELEPRAKPWNIFKKRIKIHLSFKSPSGMKKQMKDKRQESSPSPVFGHTNNNNNKGLKQ
jgi:hypothetical protein